MGGEADTETTEEAMATTTGISTAVSVFSVLGGRRTTRANQRCQWRQGRHIELNIDMEMEVSKVDEDGTEVVEE